ncbi:MAG: HD domain-containing protein [Planctomycetes bacterium]|nr:HD domain-containing protein [Planctomycetota bacterium]
MDLVSEIMSLFAGAGQAAYHGEAVSQTEHALQTARLALAAGVDAELIAAALLHDVGHLLCGLPEQAAQRGINDTHEAVGAAWLEQHFSLAVAAPVRLHVSAKRYLCAVDPPYLEALSAASQVSLRLQGGPFSASEIAQFEMDPHFTAAVALRRWDDSAKVPGLAVPALESYRAILESVVLRKC